ncbi:MAG: ABC transporter substrate-binding protein [Alphaproteobacteria bacterium]|nr:ABC transporter substrate-binding protein [Alphaproteobacteria bacterium]
MPSLPRSVLVLLLTAFILPSAGTQSRAEPTRVLSVGGSITEIVYLLGEEERLVAVDSTSLYPPAARDLPNVGYLRRLAVEPILALAPDLIIADGDAGPEPVIEQLEAAGVALVRTDSTMDIPGVGRKIRAVASALGRAEDGARLADEITDRAEFLSAEARKRVDPPRVLFLLSVGKGAPLAAGRETAAAGIIEAAGGVNAISGYEGYKPLSPEAAVLADPEIVLVPERTLEQMGGVEAILERPEIAPTRAARNGRLVSVDGLLVFGFGPRIAEAVELLSTAFHPGAAAANAQ